MDFKKTVLTLLAIFCVIASAGVACAEDANGNDGYLQDQYSDGYAGSQYQDDYGEGQYQDGYAGSQYDGYAGSQYQDEGGWAGSQYNETLENATLNQTGNETQNVTDTNTTSPAEDTNTTAPHRLPETGNPIVLLLGVSAIAGGYAVLRRKD